MNDSSWADPQIRRMSFGAQLARNAARQPGEVVYQHGSRKVTWQEFDDRVDRLVASLGTAGIELGDRVAVLMSNCLEVAEIYLATCRLGAICVPINFRLVADEIAFILGDSEPAVIFTDEPHQDMVLNAVSRSARRISVISTARGQQFPPHVGQYDEMMASPVAVPEPDVPEGQAAFIMYTSGTTGRPKGAVLTHMNLVMSALAVGLATGGRPSRPETRLLSVPMFHIAGVASALGPMLDGGRVIIQESAEFDAVATLDLLESEQVTNCFLVPTQWQAICAVPDAANRKLALRLPYWGASVAPPSVLQAMAETFPDAPAYSAFGMTETSSVTTLLRGADAIRRMGSVGKPIPLVEVRLVDDEMNDVPVGEVGEIVYRGPTVLREYWRNPTATAEAFEGGWFHSGDLCRMDDEGFIWVVDRKKDMIISGGENIYCAEVEAVISSHAGVSEVAVVGIPHPQWVQTPCAVVVPRDPRRPPSEADIVAHCRDQLASYKKPTRVVFVDSLPRNASGKVLKYQLREELGRQTSVESPDGR